MCIIGSSSSRRSYHRTLGSFDSEALKSFASECLDLLEKSDNHFALDGLVRVDIFLHNGTLVVNEFEGIEAVYFAKVLVEEMRVNSDLEKFWENKIYVSISDLLA
jgi:hypothetical protein